MIFINIINLESVNGVSNNLQIEIIIIEQQNDVLKNYFPEASYLS